MSAQQFTRENFQKFILTQNDFERDEFYGTDKDFVEITLERFEDFLNPNLAEDIQGAIELLQNNGYQVVK